jgi:O-antigen ligase
MTIQSERSASIALHRRPAPPSVPLASLTMYALLGLMVAGPYLTLKTLPYTGEGSVLRQLAFTGIYIAAMTAARVAANPRRLFPLPLSLGLTLLWFWLSLSWAVDPDIAMRRLLLTTMIVLTVFSMVDILGYARTILIFREMMIVILAINFLSVILLPSVGIHQQLDVEGFGLDPELVGNWKGVLTQKNFAGAVCALTITVFLFDARSIKTWIRWAVILASAFFLFKTHAKTSMGMIALSLTAGWMFQVYNPRFRPLLLPALLGTLLVIVGSAIAYWSDIQAIFSRPDAFTGRVHIWSTLLSYWKDHWLFGSGYGSFWNIGGNKSPLYHYVRETDWVALVAIGHNGYIDLLCQTGLPGLVLVIMSTVIIPLGNLGSGSIPRSQRGLLASFLIFCVGHNLTETSVLDRDSIVGILMMFTIALILASARSAQSAPATAVPGPHG